MIVNVLGEYGYEFAMYGVSLSYNSTIERAKVIAPKLAFGKSGEEKFLESIYVWLEVKAPRYWWQEADTYRISTKQSQSTMHTITKHPLTQEDFEEPVFWTTIEWLNNKIKDYKTSTGEQKLEILKTIKNNLPEGFLQTRVWVVNYRTLQHICLQRRDHKLSQWRYFCGEVYLQVEHPEFLWKAE